MPAPSPEQLAAVEARLQRVLDPYRDRLELATIYGNPALRRPGANAHEWFAFEKPQSKHVGFYLLPIHQDEALRATIPPALAKRLTGRCRGSSTRIGSRRRRPASGCRRCRRRPR